MGCQIWVLAAAVILLLLSLIFGGFQRGSNDGSGPGHRLQPTAQEVTLRGVTAPV
jgi:hypothetical protein